MIFPSSPPAVDKKEAKDKAGATIVLTPPPEAEEGRFERIFGGESSGDWKIVWTRNRSVMISVQKSRRPRTLRIHEMFKSAPDDLILDIAKMAEGRRRKWPRQVNMFIAKHKESYDSQGEYKARRVTLETQGKVFNLQELYDKLRDRYFSGELSVRLGWMTPREKRRVSIKLGSYSEETHVIRIHPALDNEKVPEYVIESIIFHEMVHAHIKSRLVHGRRISHGEEFHREMDRYPDHEEADAWIKNHMGLLLPRKSRRKNLKTKARG